MSPPAPRWLLRVAAVAAAAAALGLLVSASGIVPVRASDGHWPVTRWFLDFSMRRSVATHAIGIAVPPLDSPHLAVQGAGHYELGCRPCHGGAGPRAPRVPARMTPRPPDLFARVARWDDAELFYIVYHGVKMTGMPAWPARERRDEVWAMVAFLRRLPRLDEEGYRRLVFGDTAAEVAAARARGEPVPEIVLDLCARCHGVGGGGRSAFPRLAGQRPVYLRNSLRAYARGDRHSGTMGPIAAALDPAEIEAAVRHFSSLPARRDGPSEPELPGGDRERGASIARDGVPERGIPSCVDCHGPFPGPRDEAYPNLAGQSARYLRLQLELFHANRRGGSPYAHLMEEVADRLRPDEMRDLAAWYSSLGGHESP